jgi:hypothetical protein
VVWGDAKKLGRKVTRTENILAATEPALNVSGFVGHSKPTEPARRLSLPLRSGKQHLPPKEILSGPRSSQKFAGITAENAIDNLYQITRLTSKRGDHMTAIETGHPRIAANVVQATRRRALAFLALVAASVAFLFSLAVAFGFISG